MALRTTITGYKNAQITAPERTAAERFQMPQVPNVLPFP